DQYHPGPSEPREIHVAAADHLSLSEKVALEFRRRSQGVDPEEIPSITVSRECLDSQNLMSLARLVVELGFEKSTSAARRVIEQGGVTIGPERTTITDPKAMIEVVDGLIVRVGKRKIARVRIKD